MMLREPRSRVFEDSVDRLTLQAKISGNIQAAHAHQKMGLKTEPAENGSGCDSMLVDGSQSMSKGQLLSLRIRTAYARPLPIASATFPAPIPTPSRFV